MGQQEEPKARTESDDEPENSGITYEEIMRRINSPTFQRSLGKNSLLRASNWVDEEP